MANFSLSDNPIVNYVRASREELSKVVWPTRAKVIKDTAIVITLSLLVGAFFGAMDFGLADGLQRLIDLNR